MERAGLDVKPLALFIQHYSVLLNPYVPDDRGAFLFMLFVFSLCTLELYALFFLTAQTNVPLALGHEKIKNNQTTEIK